MLESKMQAWEELQYVNCYRLNSDNRNSMTAWKWREERQPENFLKNGATTCSLNENVLVAKWIWRRQDQSKKRQLKVQPWMKSHDIAGWTATKWTAALKMAW